jgi:hypothetical protein
MSEKRVPRKTWPMLDWKTHLSEEEAALVRDCEREMEHGRIVIALAAGALKPVYNRALLRAKRAMLAADAAGQSTGQSGGIGAKP